MTEDYLAHILGNIGVPAALCFYTLFEVNRNIKRLTEAVDKLERRIERLEGKIFKENAP